MERGDKSTIAILAAIVMAGVIAMITIATQHTGMLMQSQNPMYITEDAGHLAIACKSPQQQVVFLRYDGNYAVFCCLEDMIGQNTCRFEKRILLTRTY